MPTYDYQCRQCGRSIEVIHSMTDPGPTACDVCGGALKRILYASGIIFKGSGFYKTDARSARAGSSPSKEPRPATDGRGSSAAGPSSGSGEGSGGAAPSAGAPASATDSGSGASGSGSGSREGNAG